MQKASKRNSSFRSFVIITGMSGSGMSSVTNAFEDLGYFCIDNLPLTMLATFARLLRPNDENIIAIEKAALVVSIREGQFLSRFKEEIRELEDKDLKPFVVFLEASDSILTRRFSETRRPHPADTGKGILAAIRSEKRKLKSIRESADLIIDTSDLTVHSLRRLIVERFSHAPDSSFLKIQLVSFGHKYGNPHNLDLLFDVRHLPNPYFDLSLREYSGQDERIIEFLDGHEEVGMTIQKFEDLLSYLLPFYRKEGKAYLTIGIGCTGGRHRSVMVADRLYKKLKKAGNEVSVVHRDMQK